MVELYAFLFILPVAIDIVVETLNLSFIRRVQYDSVKDIFETPEAFQQAVAYNKERVLFSLATGGIEALLLIIFIKSGAFNKIHSFFDRAFVSDMVSALFFLSTLFVLSYLLSTLFSIYHTFVIEKKYGFNRTTARLFIVDAIKGFIISFLLMLLLAFAAGISIKLFGKSAAIVIWLAVIAIELAFYFIWPVVILPMFNKMTPIPDGMLKNEINEYINKQAFPVKDIYIIDASKRNTKGNAFFAGFGRNRRIALFDTLTKVFTPKEITAILAHEVGHYKKRHNLKLIIANSIVLLAVMAGIVRAAYGDFIYEAFGLTEKNIYCGLIFGLISLKIFQPFIGLFANFLSRKFEFEADAYAGGTYDGSAFVSALEKLAAQNLAIPIAHPIKIAFDYSHPPIYARAKRLKGEMANGQGNSKKDLPEVG